MILDSVFTNRMLQDALEILNNGNQVEYFIDIDFPLKKHPENFFN